jgi:hypothetical protein
LLHDSGRGIPIAVGETEVTKPSVEHDTVCDVVFEQGEYSNCKVHRPAPVETVEPLSVEELLLPEPEDPAITANAMAPAATPPPISRAFR